MDILIITLFVSLLLVIAGLVLFVLRLGAGDFEHGERLSLLPLQDEITQDERAQDERAQDERRQDERRQDEPLNSFEKQPTRALSHSGS